MTSVPRQLHPDLDALADLAADVLPVDEARAVEAHVMGCSDCADLLADAERIRPVLLTDDPGPMPDDVWARVWGSLAGEAAARGGPAGHVVPMAPVPPPDQVPWDAGHWEHAGVTGSVGAGSGDGRGDGRGDGGWSGWETNPLQPGAAITAAAEPTQAAAPVSPTPVSPTPISPTPISPAPISPAPISPAPISPAPIAATGDRPTRRSRRGEARPAPDRGPQPSAPGPERPEAADDTTGYTRVVRQLADLTPSAGAERGETGTLPALGGSRVTGALRPGRGTGPSRRDARDSDREPTDGGTLLDRLPTGRRVPLLAAAAGVIGAAVIGGIVWSVIGGGDGSLEAGPGASGAAVQQALRAPVVGTGKNYTGDDLAEQASALAEKAKSAAAPSTGPAAGPVTAAANGTPGADPTGSVPASGESKLSDPAVLARCLTALSAEDQDPIAVDIARYENRDAAIIVLRSPDGGVEAWAVSRDCGSGNAASFGFAAVAS